MGYFFHRTELLELFGIGDAFHSCIRMLRTYFIRNTSTQKYLSILWQVDRWQVYTWNESFQYASICFRVTQIKQSVVCAGIVEFSDEPGTKKWMRHCQEAHPFVGQHSLHCLWRGAPQNAIEKLFPVQVNSFKLKPSLSLVVLFLWDGRYCPQSISAGR